MKKLIVLLMVMLPIVLKAQSEDKLSVKEILPANGYIYVLDGKKVTTEEYDKAVSKGNIQSFRVSKDPRVMAQYGDKASIGVMFASTNNRTIPSYKDRFMALSADYKAYMYSHSYDDKEFIYVLDAVQVPNDQNRFRLLDDIPNDKIAGVTVMHDEPGLEKGSLRIYITTKK